MFRLTFLLIVIPQGRSAAVVNQELDALEAELEPLYDRVLFTPFF